MPSALSDPHFHDEEAAYAWVEARVWPDGPVCPHCGATSASPDEGPEHPHRGPQVLRLPQALHRQGRNHLRGSHFPALWLQAIYLMCASKKGISTHQLHRILGVTLKTAWFMSHRIREAMREAALAPPRRRAEDG